MSGAIKAVEAGLIGEADQNEVPNQSPAQTMAGTPSNAEKAALSRSGSNGTAVGSQHEKTDIEKAGGDDIAPGEGEAAPGVNQSGILTGARLYLVFLSMMLCVFMFALDQSIVATAIPIIVSDFNSFSEVSWIITGYFLTQCGLILLVGQLLTVIKAKWLLLSAVFFFELGSLICAVSQSMPVLIVGRAIQGIGSSGMFVSLLNVIVTITTVQQRPSFMASFGFVFVISSVVGPLLGGVFTQHVSWRWCFWINLPFGGIAAAAVTFLLPASDPVTDSSGKRQTVREGLKKLDYIGAALILVVVTCLLLALQWGGNQYAWSNWRIILLFCLGGVLIFVFSYWQTRLGKKALIPFELFKNRTEVGGSVAIFMMMMGMLGGTYQIPLFYQAVKDHSPTQAGIDIIPFMISVCVGIFISGGLTQKTGRYLYFILAGPPICIVGFGLLYTITATTPNAKLIGYQILAGFGIGLAFQNILLAVQAEYADRPHLIPQATGVISFFQLTGGALGIGIVNTVQSVYLNEALRKDAPNVDFNLVRESVTAIYTLPVDEQGPVIDAYVTAITKSFLPIFIALAIGWVGAFFIKNRDLRKVALPAGGAVAA